LDKQRENSLAAMAGPFGYVGNISGSHLAAALPSGDL
jgi:hypothetical protein